MPAMMKALSWVSVGEVKLIDHPRPNIQLPTDAIVRVTHASVCGTDVHVRDGVHPESGIGRILGHEGVGYVEFVGADVKNFRAGDRWKALLLLSIYTSWAAVLNVVNALLLDKFGRIKLVTVGMIGGAVALYSGENNRSFISGTSTTINEEAVPRLVEIFLSRVHTKCPVLDVETARKYASDVARDGLRWNGATSLTLIMAALGCIAPPFSDLYNLSTLSEGGKSSEKLHSSALVLGKLYYDAACKRIGLLDASILSTQCIFLCGVYEMYILNPLKAWRWFSHSSSTVYTYLRCQDIYVRDNTSVTESSDVQRLEASIYWSAYKSMCELRTELPLPASLLAEVKYGHLLPTPPSNLASAMDTDESASLIFEATLESFS